MFGFKAFLADSGVPEFPPVDPAELAAALADVDALFVVHAEDPDRLRPPRRRPRRTRDFLASRPPTAETRAVATAARRGPAPPARGCTSCTCPRAEALPVIAAARADGVRVTAETCPHYLTLDAEQVPDGATEFKCCPPIRDGANRDALWAGLADGDHRLRRQSTTRRAPPDLKRPDTGDFARRVGRHRVGAARAAARCGPRPRPAGHALADVVAWMARRPGRPGRPVRQGPASTVGADADLVAFDPDAPFVVDPAAAPPQPGHALRRAHA